MDRRVFLEAAAALLATAPFAGCRTILPVEQFGTSIDSHCHVFNASDLPAVRFIRYAFLEEYPETERVQLLDVHDPDVLDRLLEFFIAMMGANRAPSAAAETAVLDGKAPVKSRHSDFDTAVEIAIESVSTQMQTLQTRMLLSDTTARRADSVQKLLSALSEAGGNPKLASAQPLTAEQTRVVAASAFRSDTDIGVYLRWFTLFTLYRHTLVDRLASDTSEQGLNAVMLSPATVDFDHWLNESVDRSPLSAQIEVMDRIARRPKGPAVHGYFGFDPLREIYFRENTDGEQQSPLVLARKALVDHGFLGVKLYPPMGFRASQNSGEYPKFVTRRIGNPSKRLDDVLAELYDLCIELHAPVLAHAYGSNGAAKHFEQRADPAYWIPVFEAHPRLRVCFAHFGRFDLASNGSPGKDFPEKSWEWTLGRHLKGHPNSNVVADLSYFSEVLNADQTERKRLAGNFRRFIDEFDPNVEHLVYGTDWIMIGLQGGYPHYAQSVSKFLKEDCQLSDDACQRIFRGNAARFMGLGLLDGARARLAKFYKRHGLDISRLPSS